MSYTVAGVGLAVALLAIVAFVGLRRRAASRLRSTRVAARGVARRSDTGAAVRRRRREKTLRKQKRKRHAADGAREHESAYRQADDDDGVEMHVAPSERSTWNDDVRPVAASASAANESAPLEASRACATGEAEKLYTPESTENTASYSEYSSSYDSGSSSSSDSSSSDPSVSSYSDN